jgi:hypothetical protein
MHELNADAFASDRMPVAVRTDYDEFAIHSLTHRKFRKVLHCRPTIARRPAFYKSGRSCGGPASETSASVRSQAGSSKGSSDLASLEGIIVGSMG